MKPVCRLPAILVVLCLVVTLFPAFAGPHDRRGRVELRGELEVLQEDDFTTGRSRMRYRLHERAGGEVFDLEFVGTPSAGLQTGTQVVVRGLASGRVIEMEPENGLEIVQRSSTTPQARAAVILIVDFQDAAVTCSDSYVTNLMFDGSQSVDGLYQDSSFGLISFPRDTDGDGQADLFRVSIGATTTDPCDPFGWASAADAAAQSTGVVLSQYQHTVYVLPPNSCGWSGYAHVGCSSTCKAWTRYCNMPDILAHELGHNLGLRHASSDFDNDDLIDNNYGDVSDFMGIGGMGWRQVNGPHKEQMGWIPPGQIVELSTPGTQNVVLSPLEVDPAAALYPQLIKIDRPANGDTYYLSFRRPLGYDAGLNVNYKEKTSIHSYDGGSTNTLVIEALADGETFTDQVLGLSVTQLQHDDLSATVQITLPDVCDDPDGDGVCTGSDNCPTIRNAGQADSDSDGMGNGCDSDDDNDGLTDAQEAALGTSRTDPDTDNDGFLDPVDNCPTQKNAGQADSDGDGAGNPCDDDDDNDGLTDAQEAALGTSRTNPDTDNDGSLDAVDNCPTERNAGQADTDGDGMGNGCDPDDDNDGVPDTGDNCRVVPNAAQTDTDGDGIGDACDPS